MVVLGIRSCFHSFPISSRSSRYPWFRIPPQTQLERGVGRSGKIGKNGKSGERLGRDRVRVPLMFPLFPNLFPLYQLFPLSAVSVVSYFAPKPSWEMGVGRSGHIGKNGRSGERLGRDWEGVGLGFRLCFHSFPISSHSSNSSGSPWFRRSRIPPQTQLGKGRGAQFEDRAEWEEWEEWEEIGKG